MKNGKKNNAFPKQNGFIDLQRARMNGILKDYDPYQFEIKFNLRQVSKILRVPQRTLVDHIHKEKLIGDNRLGKYLIHQKDLQAYITEYHHDNFDICLSRYGIMRTEIIERNFSNTPRIYLPHSIEELQEVFDDLIDRRELDDSGRLKND